MAGRRCRVARIICAAVLLLAGCAATTPGEPAPSQPARQPERSTDPWSEPLQDAGAGCVGLARAALASRRAPPGLALRRGSGAEAVANDLHLADPTPAARCVLVVAAPRPVPTRQRRVVSRENVSSSYAMDAERVANPAREELRKALSRAERSRGADARVFATGDPVIDLIGSAAELVVAGVDKMVRLQQEAALRRQLDEAPVEIERQRTRRYSYTQVRIEARRGAVVRSALVDPLSGEARETVAQALETTDFDMDEGRRPTDLGRPVSQPPVDLAAVAAWEAGLPPVLVSDVLAQLLEAAAVRRETTDQLLARWAVPDESVPESGGGPQAASASLVHVAGAVLEGAGFVVADGKVLTLDRLVSGSDLVKVTGPDGRSSFAIVERRDRRRGLALLRVTLPMKALTLADALPGSAEAMLAWPGGPPAGAPGRLARDGDAGRLLWQAEQPVRPPGGSAALIGDQVTAMVTETGDLGAVLLPAAELRAFMAAGG